MRAVIIALTGVLVLAIALPFQGCGDNDNSVAPPCCPACGDGVCSGDEGPCNCGIDCKQPSTVCTQIVHDCGNGVCSPNGSPGESHERCPVDCPLSCRQCGDFDQSRPDYDQCHNLTGAPLTASCDGLDCAKDDQARHFLSLFLDVLQQHGVADQHEVLNAEIVAEFVQIEYVVTIDWFRGANAWLIPIADDATFVADLEQKVCLTLPNVSPYELVFERASDCDAALAAGLCCGGPSPNNGCVPICSSGSSTPAPNDCTRVNHVSIDVRDASTLECSIGQLACP